MPAATSEAGGETVSIYAVVEGILYEKAAWYAVVATAFISPGAAAGGRGREDAGQGQGRLGETGLEGDSHGAPI